MLHFLLSRELFALCVSSFHWSVHQTDITQAFTYGHLDPNHQIYFRIPRGFPKSGTNQVLKPERSVYGFRQAPTAFKDKLTAFMLMLNALLLRMQVQLGFCEGALKF